MILKFRNLVRNFLSSIIRNKQLSKYIFFFFISCSFWFLSILSKTHEITLSIPIKYIHDPINLVEVEKPDKLINVRVKAAGISIISFSLFNKKSLILNYDLANFKLQDDGHILFWIMNSMRKEISWVLGNNIEIMNISPEKVSSFFVNKAKKEVPVLLNSDINLRQEYWMMNEPVINPSSVLLFGKQEILDSIINVTTNLLNVNDIYKDESYEVGLIIPNSVKSNNQSVLVKIDVDPFVEEVFSQNVEIRNLRKGYTMKIFPRDVMVTLRIPKDKYQFLKFNSLNLYVDASKCIEEKILSVNYDNLPNFIKIVRIYPNKLEYLLIKE